MKHCAVLFAIPLSVVAGQANAQQGVTKPVIRATPSVQPPSQQTPSQPAAGAGQPSGQPGAGATTTPLGAPVQPPLATTPPETQNPAGASSPTGAPGASTPGTPAAGPGTPSSPPQQAPGVSADTYQISQGDTIQVNVWREPGLSGIFPVRPDGMISMPLIGDIVASNFTPMSLGTDIANRLKKYINDPSVTITVTAVRPKEIYLLGEVQRVGPVVLTPGMSVLQAIAAGGGLTTFANTKRVYILRGQQGHQTKIPFDYRKAIKGDSQQDITLAAGDTIVVR